MTSQVDEWHDFYQDSSEENDEKFLDGQLKRWNKLKHAVLVIFIVIITLLFIKCMKRWIRKKNEKSEFAFYETL